MLIIPRLAKLLAAFADENGTPNGVSPGELCDGHSIRPMDVGRILASRLDALNAELRTHGYFVTSYADAGGGYGKRISIDAAPPPAAEGDWEIVTD